MKLVLLGPPGCGKGTQGEKISQSYGIPWISTGNILRSAMESKTTLGLQAAGFMAKGGLAPDWMVEKLVAERLREGDCKKGFVLDGYPRDLDQAKALEQIASPDVVLEIRCSEKKALERISNRRMCECGESYHLLYHPPAKPGVCDKCGRPLFQRKDDSMETVRHRFQVYRSQSKPVLDYYRQKNMLLTLDGEKGIDEVFEEIKYSLLK